MPIPDGEPVFSAQVDIDLRDGTTLSHRQRGILGEDQADALVAAVAGLDASDEVGTLSGLLGRGNPNPR
jgi:hypothetical protein